MLHVESKQTQTTVRECIPSGSVTLSRRRNLLAVQPWDSETVYILGVIFSQVSVWLWHSQMRFQRPGNCSCNELQVAQLVAFSWTLRLAKYTSYQKTKL